MKRADITSLFPDATDEQIKALMDINGADINNAKRNVDELQKQLTTANATIEELQAGVSGYEEAQNKAKLLEAELTELKTANAIKAMREKVASEVGVPVSLLTGADEESCKAQAQGILEFAKPSYPKLKDGGEPLNTQGKPTRELFADWLNSQGG